MRTFSKAAIPAALLILVLSPMLEMAGGGCPAPKTGKCGADSDCDNGQYCSEGTCYYISSGLQ